MTYPQMSADELRAEKASLEAAYRAVCKQHLSLNLARGKPSSEQLDLSEAILSFPATSAETIAPDGMDTRNYGFLTGVPALRSLFADLLGVGEEDILLGTNSTLSMIYDAVCRAVLFGVCDGCKPWKDQGTIRFLCPTPGYDRHFAICEKFGIEMIPVAMTGHGPDMDAVEALVADPQVKGMLCVPKYANPTGETYDAETVRRIAALKPAARDFRVFWDMAYLLHDLDETPDTLGNIFTLVKGTPNEDLVLGFFSTSKITYPGAGVAMMISGKANVERAVRDISIRMIGPDKINQLRHLRYLQNAAHMKELMREHAAILGPKMDAAARILDEELTPCGVAHFVKPHGGYFISLNVYPGTAKRTEALAKAAGVTLTPAGAAFPYHRDPNDENLRIAPSYPPLAEVEAAMRVVALCAKLAAAEVLLR